MMDFKELCEREPGLKALERDILDFRTTKRRLGSDVTRDWYRRFKPRLCELVGFTARDPELCGCDCYDTAYSHLYGLLTDRPGA
jgi:hypothetical protein